MNPVGINTQTGIELARQGHTVEALAYLRQAVSTEALTADVWLWLAHVTPDREEYRHCVAQALALQPDHPTALRMQQDIRFQNDGLSPPLTATQTARTMHQPYARQQRWRRWAVLLVAILLVGGCGLAWQALAPGLNADTLRDWLPFFEEQRRLQFAVGDEDEVFRFRVDVPRTWYLADEDSPSWVAERNRLQSEFAENDAALDWRSLETNLNDVTRDAETGVFEQPIIIVETESAQINANPASVAQLRLLAVTTPERAPGDDLCDTLRALADDTQEGFIAAEFRTQEDRCLYYTHFQSGNVRDIRLNIPVDEARVAQWQLRIPDAQYNDYDEAVTRILDSLAVVPPGGDT